MAQMKAASGGAAIDRPAGFHETGTVAFDGTPGTYEVWADLRALRSATTHTIAGRTRSSGFDGRRTWSVGPDGVVTTDDSPQGVASARLGTYLTIGAYFYPERFPARFDYRGRREADGKEFDVVTVTPAESPAADLWLDLETHRLSRISGSDGTTSFTGAVERYEVVDGVWVPFVLSQTQGAHRIQQELTSVVFESVPAERFAPPESGR